MKARAARFGDVISKAFVFAMAVASAVVATPVGAWDDRGAGADLPLLGKGGAAHYYTRESACFGCTTGSKSERRWGRSAFSGEDPYITVGKAMQFLFTDGGMAKAAKSIGAGAVGDDSGIIEPRALPYHMTVVMIEPTVIVMNFDLGALVHEGELREGPVVGTPYIDGYLTYGTHVPATGTLLWFSPTTRSAPAPVSGQQTGHGEIVVAGARLTLERRGNEWLVSAK